MKTRHVSLAILYTKTGKILLQKRDSNSRWNEEWSFFGGGIESGETSEDALKREIWEELEYKLTEYTFAGTIQKVMKEKMLPQEEWDVTIEFFLAEIPEDISLFTLHEGGGMKFFTIEQALKLKTAAYFEEAIELFQTRINKHDHDDKR